MDRLKAKIAKLVGEPVVALDAASGGDINSAFEVALKSGRKVFVKAQRSSRLPELFIREAEGLEWLAEASALRTPKVIAATDDDADGPACLVLELIPKGRPNREHDERLGRGLAALHRFGAPTFGHATSNYLATLEQDNVPSEDWPAFYAERRLMALTERAAKRGLLSSSFVTRMTRLCERMQDFAGPPEPAARLHGDLWGGNALAAEGGEPVLIDPAVYGGHREIDLAMMQLFGGFSSRVFEAYDEAYPRAPGHEDRVALYQLYPLLAHVNLFGSGYVSQTERALSHYV